MKLLINIVILSVFLIGCSPSTRAIKALNEGDHCTFCRISAESVSSDYYSINNLGLCYLNGWCGYTQDTTKAVEHFNLAARWGVNQAISNLAALGHTAPAPDLKLAADQQRQQNINAFLGTVLAVGLVAVAANQSGRASGYNSYNANQPSFKTVSAVNSYNLLQPRLNFQGCCSHHLGIMMGVFNQPICHFSGMVMCNDWQPSPSCRCN